MNGNVPPLPRSHLDRGRKLAVVAAIVGALVFLGIVALVVLRVSGLIGFYRLPTASMAPAINGGDDIFVERVTYLHRQPERGEVIAFKTDQILGTQHPGARAGEKYVKRLVGLPGDQLRISGGILYVNDQPAAFRNRNGEIHYTVGLGKNLRREDETFTVPAGAYFVLGDNSPNSADSRMWGTVPAEAVVGRVVLCYWPKSDAGWVR